MIDNSKRISKIGEKWFLSEPLLFSVYCTHEFKENSSLSIPFRTGHGRIEYNDSILNNLSDRDMEEFLKLEMIRILLKHPYQRLPSNAEGEVLTVASNVTVTDNYKIRIKTDRVEDFENLQHKLCFEEYYHQLLNWKNKADKDGKPEDESEEEKDDEPETQNEVDEDKNDEEQNIAGQDLSDEISKADENTEPAPIPDMGENEGSSDQTTEEDAESKESGESKNKADSLSENEEGEKGTDDSTQEGTDASGEEDLSAENMGTDSADKRNNPFDSMDSEKKEELSELWEENQEVENSINECIQGAMERDLWGSVPGELQEILKASLHVELDYRQILHSFKTSITSSHRKLTRMKPSRRFGFEMMGSRYDLAANLLLAVDVSGSVSKEEVSYFYGIINKFFKYGIENLDVFQFDYALKSKRPVEMKKAKNQITIQGRGGTNFQPVADYYSSHPEYDGLIYFTDGYARLPVYKTKRLINVLWVYTSKAEYDVHKEYVEKLPRNRCTYIPMPE